MTLLALLLVVIGRWSRAFVPLFVFLKPLADFLRTRLPLDGCHRAPHLAQRVPAGI